MNQKKIGKFIQQCRKRGFIQILCNIMQGVGMALLFVPVYKESGVVLGSVIVMSGVVLFVAGLCIKLRR